MRPIPLSLGVVVLAVAWIGPLPELARHSFAAHMAMHMAVVAVAAPLLALAVSNTPVDPTRMAPALFLPLPASFIELAVIWAWHTPAWHEAARQQAWAFLLEQISFAAAGLLLWIAVCGGDRHQRFARRGAGIVALLFTSMHMTLLGALFALANRPLFPHAGHVPAAMPSLADQHLGGAIMLLVGGASYLAGALWLAAGVLQPPRSEVIERQSL